MKILSTILFLFLLSTETLQTLDAKKVNTIKLFLRKLVQTSLDNFKKKLAVQMRERESQTLKKKQNRKLFFGFFRHKKKAAKQELRKKSSPVKSQVFSKTIDFSQQIYRDLDYQDIYERVQSEITIEKIVDSIVEEGFGEEMLRYLKRKLKQKKRKRRQYEIFPKPHYDYFSMYKKPKKHKHNKKHNIKIKKNNKKSKERKYAKNHIIQDPLLEIYTSVYPEQNVLKTSTTKESQVQVDKKKQENKEMKELDDFLNNYYMNTDVKSNKIYSSFKETNPLIDVWGFKKKI